MQVHPFNLRTHLIYPVAVPILIVDSHSCDFISGIVRVLKSPICPLQLLVAQKIVRRLWQWVISHCLPIPLQRLELQH